MKFDQSAELSPGNCFRLSHCREVSSQVSNPYRNRCSDAPHRNRGRGCIVGLLGSYIAVHSRSSETDNYGLEWA